MSVLPIMDNILYNVQRQGKISFYVRQTGSSLWNMLIAIADDIGGEPTFIRNPYT